MRSIDIGASVPAFLGKLWKLVNDTETNHLISWSSSGKSFCITNQAEFARELLPLYYKHNNMASFIRQLNMYGFHKITSVENGGLRFEKDEIEFSHPCFMKGHSYLLEHIKRKIANTKSMVTSREDGEKNLFKPELMNKVLGDVKQMKGKQESLDAKFSVMKQENEALWREVAILRQKHIKQQQIVNNLIQFLMSLVQPSRTGNTNPNGVGMKRPYQLMINNAAHTASSDHSYPGNIKNIRLNKKSVSPEGNNEENPEDGPTIHELAHDDVLHSESSATDLDPNDFLSVASLCTIQSPNDASTSTQYHVTMEDGDDLDQESTGMVYPNCQEGILPSIEVLPMTTTNTPINQAQFVINPDVSKVSLTSGQSKLKSKTRENSNIRNSEKNNLLSPSHFNVISPATDLKLPAEIFENEEPYNDLPNSNISSDTLLQDTISYPNNVKINAPSDQMLSGNRNTVMNFNMERPMEQLLTNSKMTKSKTRLSKDNANKNENLLNIKKEVEDDLDWNNMSLATVNNNTNLERLHSVADIDDHLDSMQTDLDSLRELLRNDNYAVDANTLLGLFGSDDLLYGLSFNPVDERQKCSENAQEPNQLMSYTGNMPDFIDIEIPTLEAEDSQDSYISDSLLDSNSVLNTPQITLNSPGFPKKR